MPRAQITLVVQSPSNGSAIVGASVTVRQHSNGSQATIYTSETGTGALPSNVITTDGNGRCTNGGAPLWLNQGTYDFQVSGTNLTTYTVTRELVSADTLVAGQPFPGELRLVAIATAPSGWLLCDGSAVSRSLYAALYGALGGASSPWGQGDGSSTFNVPDLRGRVPVGAGQGPSLTSRPLATTGGEEKHVLTTGEMPAHSHGVSDPGHAHGHSLGTDAQGAHAHNVTNQGGQGGVYITGSTGSYQSGSSFGPFARTYLGTDVQGAHGHNITGGISAAGTGIGINSAGSGSSHNNMQPFVGVNYIIKT